MNSNFPTKKLYIPGGFKSFLFIQHDQVTSHPAVRAGIISQAFGIAAGASWSTGYSTAETLNFKEECVPSPNGPSYVQTISGFVPGDQPELISLMQLLEGLELIVELVDTKRQRRVVGSHGYPLVFIGNYDSGSNRSDAKGFSYKITNSSILRAPVYKP